jgi:hypothetical protein
VRLPWRYLVLPGAQCGCAQRLQPSLRSVEGDLAGASDGSGRRQGIAALHEAGHAVAAWAQDVGMDYATIEHEEGATDRIALEHEPRLLESIARMERLIRIFLAGPIAQQRACGDTGVDQVRAGADMIIVRALFLVICGCKIDCFPKFIARLTAQTEALINEPMNWARMLAVGDALVERRMLTGEELVEVIKAVPAGIDPPPPTCPISYGVL